MAKAPKSTTTQAAKLLLRVRAPIFSASSATGVALANPTLSKADSTPQLTAMNIPLDMLEGSLVSPVNLSLSIPAFAVRATPTNMMITARIT